MPSRLAAFLFLAKAKIFQLRRGLLNLFGNGARQLPKATDPAEGRILAESRSLLYPSSNPAEFALQAGKVQNLRTAARHLDGRLMKTGSVFSFWAHVPRPTAGRGFAPGRELREGCVIPSVGGGLCQLSNALYDAVLKAGFEVIERHAHSRKLPGSMAVEGRDATVFWNYVDLRFRAPEDCVLEAMLTQRELIVRLRSCAETNAGPEIKDCGSFQPDALKQTSGVVESCETCGVLSCFRNPAASGLPQCQVNAWLVDAWTPEMDGYAARQHKPGDVLLVPLNSRRWKLGPYRWDTTGYAQVKESPWFVLRRSLQSRRLVSQGARRQTALLKMDSELAAQYARHIPYTALHVVVSQNLLPHVWRTGALAGRTFDVLMTRLPMSELQSQLDLAATRWPESRTLADFRVNAALLDAEKEALEHARHWITPHSAIATLAGSRAIQLEWHLPKGAIRKTGSRIVFPASTVGRKGAFELREAARQLNLKLTLIGSELEGDNFWNGLDVCKPGDDWLADTRAVVLPAWVEHQPRRLLQAITAGIPVVASAACGLTATPGVKIIPDGDIEALKSALQNLES